MLGAATTPAQLPFTLRADGKDLTRFVPVGDEFRAHVLQTTDGPGEMTFTVEDTGLVHLQLGAEVTLSDWRNLEDLQQGEYPFPVFGGHLVNTRLRRRSAGAARLIDCTAVGYGAWLDWAYIPTYQNWNSRNPDVWILSDSVIVQQLVRQFPNPLLAPDWLIETTQTGMPKFKVKGVSLREALDQVADAATKWNDVANRLYFVDFSKRLHWYKDIGRWDAPYRISDGSYTRTVMSRASLVSLWTLSGDTVALDAKGYAHAPHNGGPGTRQRGGIVNEPLMRAYRFNGSSSFLNPTGANLHPGDTFTVEFWAKRVLTGAQQTVWSGGTDDVEVGFDASDHLVVIKEGTGNHFVSDATYTDSRWHHYVVARSPGSTAVYVDGSSISGTTTARTFVAGSGTVNIGRRKSSTDRYFGGLLQHVAVYDSRVSAAAVRANHNQGISLVPEEMVLERDAMEGREAVYVHGGKAGGIGWVYPGQTQGVTINTAFGSDSGTPVRRDGIDRPDSDTAAKRLNYGAGFLKAHSDPQVSGSFTVTGYGGWQVNQTLYITDSQLLPDDPTGYRVEIKEIETDVLMGNGIIQYTIHFGRAPRSGARYLARATHGRGR